MFIILGLCLTSMYISNQALQTTLYPDLTQQDFARPEEFNSKHSNDFGNSTPGNITGYGYTYPNGCDIVSPTDLWTEVVPQTVYVISTFHDNRDEPSNLRMIAAVYSESKTDLWCHFTVRNLSISSEVVFEEMSENHNLPFGGWILSCKVPDIAENACTVALSTSPVSNGGQSPLTNMSILATETLAAHKQVKQRFAVCIPPIFGKYPPDRLVEFFELMHHLGADKIFTYVLTNDTEIRRVLRYYEQKQYAVLLPWKLPFSDVLSRNITARIGNYSVKINSIWYNGQLLAANDCLYRTMPNFEYTLFSDLDEILVPKSILYNWENVINKIKKESTSGYSFKSAYFEKCNKQKLFTLLNVRTAEFSPSRNKVMVQPTRVLEVGIHHISRSMHVTKKYHVHHVPESVAFIHHFRKCQNERGLNCLDTVTDDSVKEKYNHFLSEAVTKALLDIKTLSFEKTKFFYHN